MVMKTIFLIILFQLWTTALLCCSCDGESTVKEGIEGSNLVASATVISQTITTNLQQLAIIQGDTTDFTYKLLKYPSRVVKLKITTLYKGQVSSDTIIIITPPNGASCGVHFEVGKQYIIYGTTQDEVNQSEKNARKSANNTIYWTHSCSRTSPWCKDEEAEIIKLTKNKQAHKQD
jgi:hypothetical protein